MAPPIRLLHVDDLAEMLNAVKAAFEQDEQEPRIEVVAQATTGGEGLRRYIEHQPDILLTNIHMPTMDGLTMSREVLEYEPSAKIIFLTATIDVEKVGQAAELGAYGYLLKPADVIELRSVVRDVAMEAKSPQMFYYGGWGPRAKWLSSTASKGSSSTSPSPH